MYISEFGKYGNVDEEDKCDYRLYSLEYSSTPLLRFFYIIFTVMTTATLKTFKSCMGCFM